MSDQRGSDQPIVGGTISGLVVLGSIRKQAEQVRGSKPVSNIPPWPLHQLLPPGSCPVWVPVLTSFSDELWYGSVNQINPFFSKSLWSWYFIIATEILTKTGTSVLIGEREINRNGNKQLTNGRIGKPETGRLQQWHTKTWQRHVMKTMAYN